MSTNVDDLNASMRMVGEWGQRMHEEMLRVADAAFPGWRERLEHAGYQGNRCGWYPEKPKRRRPARR